MSAVSDKDTVRVRDLLLLVFVADGAQWPSPTSAPVRQPIRVSVSIPYDLRPAAQGDDISKSINYGSLSKRILTSVDAPSSLPLQFDSLDHFSDHVFDTCFDAFAEIQRMTVDVVKPRALPYAEGIRILSSRARDGSHLIPDHFSIQRLSCNLVVGLNPCEREDKQLVYFDVDISMSQTRTAEIRRFKVDFRQLGRDIRQQVESSEFVSLESLASLVAQIALGHANQPNAVVTVRAAKPKAIVFADAAEVEIVRTSRDYPGSVGESAPEEPPSLALDPPFATSPLGLISAPPSRSKGQHLVAIALGSNLGDRFANIEAALRLLEHDANFLASEKTGTTPNLAVVNTSFLYETAPMYVTDQPSFLNCACIIRTTAAPLTLLDLIKNVERTVGRVPSIRNGPRAVDLDILFYDDAIIDTRPESFRGTLEGFEGHLVVPHPRIAEREFVLRPLQDMVPDFVHPVLRKPIHEMLCDELRTSSSVRSPAMINVMPFPTYPHSTALTASPPPPVANIPQVPHTHTYWKFPPAKSAVPAGQVLSTSRRTRLMATLNVTPDSFSDGSDNAELSAALNYVKSSVAAAADIVDVGGYSTRPGAAYVSSEEELNRVVPVIEAIRALDTDSDDTKNVLISVDTFRPDVARAAVLAGANCINDVHAFTGPDYTVDDDDSNVAVTERRQQQQQHLATIKDVARTLAVPVVLMHSRGDAGNNKDYSCYASVLDGVSQELGAKVEAIVRGPGGVRRWLVMVDPGIGFSKSVEDNVRLLRDSASITADVRNADGSWNPLRGFPQLIGTSRKSFLGTILSQIQDDGTYKGRQTTPKERSWATAAAVASAVQQGANVVRVHDVLELGDVVRVADAIWN